MNGLLRREAVARARFECGPQDDETPIVPLTSKPSLIVRWQAHDPAVLLRQDQDWRSSPRSAREREFVQPERDPQ